VHDGTSSLALFPAAVNIGFNCVCRRQ
jgi:hypothetical protein